jgi:hypothetical protein
MTDATDAAPSIQDLIARLENLIARLESLESNVEHLRHALQTLFASHMAHNPPAESGCSQAAQRVAGLQIRPPPPAG